MEQSLSRSQSWVQSRIKMAEDILQSLDEVAAAKIGSLCQDCGYGNAGNLDICEKEQDLSIHIDIEQPTFTLVPNSSSVNHTNECVFRGLKNPQPQWETIPTLPLPQRPQNKSLDNDPLSLETTSEHQTIVSTIVTSPYRVVHANRTNASISKSQEKKNASTNRDYSPNENKIDASNLKQGSPKQSKKVKPTMSFTLEQTKKCGRKSNSVSKAVRSIETSTKASCDKAINIDDLNEKLNNPFANEEFNKRIDPLSPPDQKGSPGESKESTPLRKDNPHQEHAILSSPNQASKSRMEPEFLVTPRVSLGSSSDQLNESPAVITSKGIPNVHIPPQENTPKVTPSSYPIAIPGTRHEEMFESKAHSLDDRRSIMHFTNRDTYQDPFEETSVVGSLSDAIIPEYFSTNQRDRAKSCPERCFTYVNSRYSKSSKKLDQINEVTKAVQEPQQALLYEVSLEDSVPIFQLDMDEDNYTDNFNSYSQRHDRLDSYPRQNAQNKQRNRLSKEKYRPALLSSSSSSTDSSVTGSKLQQDTEPKEWEWELL